MTTIGVPIRQRSSDAVCMPLVVGHVATRVEHVDRVGSHNDAMRSAKSGAIVIIILSSVITSVGPLSRLPGSSPLPATPLHEKVMTLVKTIPSDPFQPKRSSVLDGPTYCSSVVNARYRHSERSNGC